MDEDAGEGGGHVNGQLEGIGEEEPEESAFPPPQLSTVHVGALPSSVQAFMAERMRAEAAGKAGGEAQGLAPKVSIDPAYAAAALSVVQEFDRELSAQRGAAPVPIGDNERRHHGQQSSHGGVFGSEAPALPREANQAERLMSPTLAYKDTVGTMGYGTARPGPIWGQRWAEVR